jgi:hypothetical protein
VVWAGGVESPGQASASHWTSGRGRRDPRAGKRPTSRSGCIRTGTASTQRATPGDTGPHGFTLEYPRARWPNRSVENIGAGDWSALRQTHLTASPGLEPPHIRPRPLLSCCEVGIEFLNPRRTLSRGTRAADDEEPGGQHMPNQHMPVPRPRGRGSESLIR